MFGFRVVGSLLLQEMPNSVCCDVMQRLLLAHLARASLEIKIMGASDGIYIG